MEKPSAMRSRRYEEKKMKLEDALALIKTGDHIFVGSACGEPQYLVRGLVEKGSHLADNEILHVHTLGVAPYAEPIYSGRFRLNAFFVGINTRQAVAEGRADYTPTFLSNLPKLIRSDIVPVDVALVQVTPPDEHGFCSLGVSVDVTKPASEKAGLVIAQVNRQMPRVLGNSFVHVSQIDVVVEHDEPILESSPPSGDMPSERIAKYVEELVEDGSTLQIGIGNIPDAVLGALRGKKDLGIHTELLTEGVVDLVEEGAVTCAKKTINQGKIIASFAMGTRRLYDFINNNPMVEFYSSDYVNDPFIIRQHERMVAINQALEVDLTGQVCSDSLGYQFYSGLGGQADFMRGANLAKGGKAITVMPSTAKDDQISRIRVHLSEGAGIVLTRGDVDFIITEFGVAPLKGKTIGERTLSLITLAHPKFRNSLLAWAKRHYYLPREILPFFKTGYPDELKKYVELEDGTKVLLRPIKPSDATMKQRLFYKYSKETVYYRYLGSIKAMPLRQLWPTLTVDYEDEMSLVGTITEEGREILIAIGNYSRIPRTKEAEVALAIRDDYQNRGLGTQLLGHLIEIAKKKGIETFTAWFLTSNTRMMHVFKKSGCPVKYTIEDDLYHLILEFKQEPQKE